MTNIVISNAGIYAAIAEEAFADMEERMERGRKPTPDGKGWILTLDPEKKSFKSALVYIAFSAMWLEATLHLIIVKKYGKKYYEKIDRKSYEEKLKILNIADPETLKHAEQFRKTRKEILHEKAHFNQENILFAQDEARKFQKFLRELEDKLTEAGFLR